MELSAEDEKDLKLMIAKKLAESGSISESEQFKMAADFYKSRMDKKKKQKEEDRGTSPLSTCAKKIHTANVMRVYKMIDKIEKSVVGEDYKLSDSLQNNMPELEIWDFSLGDRVVIDISLQRFKFMHTQTLGWRKRLGNLVGQYGFITDSGSKYDCKVQVYFPDIFASSQVYPGCLKKTDKHFHDVESRWKVGQFVKTRKSKTLVTKFQKRLPDLPEKHIGKKGRIIAVTSAGIFVTFNEKSSYAINSALLHEAENSNPIQRAEVTDHPKNFKVGDVVQVSRNLRKLIENQKDFGGWNWKMSSLAGKKVRICQIKKDGSLIVGTNHTRPWRFSYESVFSKYDIHGDFAENLEFMPGDVVRLILSENINLELLSEKVLESCIDFLRLPAVVEGIDDDFDVVVRFSNGKKHTMKPTMIKKVSKAEQQQVEAMQAKKASLEAGDLVKLSLGPKKYLEDILSRLDPKKSTIEAMTQEAELLGFLDEYHAIIRYENGRRIRVNCKYLAPAEKSPERIPWKLDFDSLRTLVENVQNGVAAVKFENGGLDDENSVEIFSVTKGMRPTVCLRIDEITVEPRAVFKWLEQFTGWTISEESEKECVVKMTDDQEFDLILLCEVPESNHKKFESVMDLEAGDEEKTQAHTTTGLNKINVSEHIKEPSENIQGQHNSQSGPPLSPLSYGNTGQPTECLYHNGIVYFPRINTNASNNPYTDQGRDQQRSNMATYNTTDIQGNVGNISMNN